LEHGAPVKKRPVRHGRPCCVLVSGGLDSIVLLRGALRVHRSVQPLYVRAGMVWEPVERRALGRLLRLLRHPRLKPLRTIDVPMGDLLAGHWSRSGRGGPGYDDGDASVFIPGRNIALFSKAATFCALEGIPALVSGILSANPFPDGSSRFLRAMERALATGLEAPFRITTPFRRLTKDRVVRMGRDLPLHLTFSCISPRRGRHCGDCCKCKERIDAFVAAGVPDRTRYAAGPMQGRRQAVGPASDGSVAPPARSASRGAARTARARTRLAANSATSSR
jgi:7-cyano-7-deazaguanine synthase